MSDFDETSIPDLPPLPGVSDGTEPTDGTVDDHLAIADGYHHHHHHHGAGDGHLSDDSTGLHLGGAKIDSVEAAIMAVTGGSHGDPPHSPTGTGQARIKRSQAGQSSKNRARCSVVGCNKQSQGARNDNMCRKHYIQYQKEVNPDHAEEIVRELAMSGKKMRAKCSVEGCLKQSQGGCCNFMCRAHFVESGGVVDPRKKTRKAPASPILPPILPPLLPAPRKMRVRAKAKAADGNEDGKGDENGDGDGEEVEYTQYLCRAEGCNRQSQGKRNSHLCRRHYSLFLKADNGVIEGGVDTEGINGVSAVNPDMPTRKQDNTISNGHMDPMKRHRRCAIVGCPKQSQGKENLKMCRAHFRAMEKAGISMEELPEWQRSQQVEVALQAEGATFAAAVDAMPPLPRTEADDAPAAAEVAAAAENAADEGTSDNAAGDQGDDDMGDDLDNDEELAIMVQREIQKLKKLQRGEDCEEHNVDQYLSNEDDNNAALASSTASANPPQPGPSPKRPRLENSTPSAIESALVKRRQQARDDVEALKAQLEAAQSKETSIMNAMEGMEECVLCQNEAKAVTMTPCGHSTICNHCAYTENKCPICLEPIDPVDPIEEDGAVAV